MTRGLDIRATPPVARMSAGTRSSAITAQAPASSAMLACSALVTSMITPPLSISARPVLTRNVARSVIASQYRAEPFSRRSEPYGSPPGNEPATRGGHALEAPAAPRVAVHGNRDRVRRAVRGAGRNRRLRARWQELGRLGRHPQPRGPAQGPRRGPDRPPGPDPGRHRPREHA